MKLSKKVQRILMASAAVLAMGTGRAMAANTPFGICSGADCVTGEGHASISVTSTLSINEMRAISFGNISAAVLGVGDTLTISPTGVRSKTGGFTPLTGANGSAAAGPTTGSQSPGHYTVSGIEAGPAQIYVSFADTSGNIIDMCDSNGVCDKYHPGKNIPLDFNGAPDTTFTLDSFTINESGSDVYGHYVVVGGNTADPGATPDPFKPGTGTQHSNGTGASPTEIDIAVGAKVTAATAGAPAVGKYTGTFQIMASY